MPRLHVVAIAARLPAWAETACADYARRMPKGYEVERLALKDESRLRAAMPKGARLIALDERGREFTTAQFAKLLQAPSAFVIGGAEGLSDATKREAQITMRLSAMTLPHALAQLVLLEQLYRAATLLTGHPYHRA
ncbi:MAG: 23S rRNA (pseudouridine(1915)-N(3))-methyltransferase RlmH [Betaproteobacteria bacterium]|nr:MAG: 23S rRNA (pseudouridine(1915)-N(3))-methyltransferase RlmH [Betaproteobacteria bacterium]